MKTQVHFTEEHPELKKAAEAYRKEASAALQCYVWFARLCGAQVAPAGTARMRTGELLGSAGPFLT